MDIKQVIDFSCKNCYIYQFRIRDENNRIKVIKSCVDKDKLLIFASEWLKKNKGLYYIKKTLFS
tara:strand:+ start:333 stop:524 length:192 start_codon:yes stop_codon:yes gene_type:complete